jgi:putative transposase
VNAPKCNEQDYINFLIATPNVYSCTEAARVQPDAADAPAHDAFTRLLQRLEPNSTDLWKESQKQVSFTTGILVLDDSTLDKPYARQMPLVSRHWSGKHKAVVRGINLITWLWSDGDRHVPCDYRIYDKASDGLTKNDHFQQMLQTARERGFQPRCVVFDSWYSGTQNLKLIRDFGWIWLTRLKQNRQVNPDRTGNRVIAEMELAESGRIVHLKEYGLIKVFKIVAPDGDQEYWATNDLQMGELTRVKYAGEAWTIEQFHRGIKQLSGIERCQARSRRAQRNHLGFALRAFLRLEVHGYRTGISWFEAKTSIIREAVRAYLAKPLFEMVTVRRTRKLLRQWTNNP